MVQPLNKRLVTEQSLTNGPAKAILDVSFVPRSELIVGGKIATGLLPAPVSGIPNGGATGQMLVKNSNANQDVGFSTTAPQATKLVTARQINGHPFDGTANITLDVKELASWSTDIPADGNVPRWDGDDEEYVPINLDDLYTKADSAGRLDPAAWQKYFVPMVIVNEGDQAPIDFPIGGLVFERPTPVSLVPTFAGSGFGNASGVTTLVFQNSVALNVGEWIGIGVMVDASTATGALPTLVNTIVPTTGSWGTPTAGPTTFQSGTIQVNMLYAKVATLIPAGTNITLTLNQTRVHRAVILFKMPNLVATTPADATAVLAAGSITGASPVAFTPIGPTAVTAQASEVAIGLIGHNDSTTAARVVAGTNGWAVLAFVESDNGTTSRTVTVLYKVLAATGTQTLTANVAGDGQTGAFAAVLTTFKGV